MFNVLRDVPAVTKIAQVAVRDFSEREAALAASSGRVVLFDDLSLAAAGFRGETWDTQCLRIVETLPQEVYVSFDIDGLSYENCPHTGTPLRADWVSTKPSGCWTPSCVRAAASSGSTWWRSLRPARSGSTP